MRENPRRVCFYKKRNIVDGLDGPPPALYSQYPIPIKKAKADDLKVLISDYVPVEYRSFYAELPVIENSE